MSPSVGLLLGLVLLLDSARPVDVEALLWIISGRADFDRDKLAKAGAFAAAALPLYHSILEDPDGHATTVQNTLSVLTDPAIKADRSRFVPAVIGQLAHPHPGVRRTAVQLLGQIGSAKDAAPVVAVLSDVEWTNAIAAAGTLAAIGDRSTLAAMDVWLKTSAPRKNQNEAFDRSFRAHIAKFRDQLRARLEREEQPGK